MKPSALIVSLAASGAVIAAVAPAVYAQAASPFTITVNVTNSKRHETTKGDGSKATASGDKSSDYKMEITVFNRTQKAFDDLTLKYFWFGTDANDSSLVTVLRQDEKALKVAALASVKLETKEVTIAYTAKKSKNENGKNVTTPATGSKYAGYGIRIVSKDGKLLAKKFEPLDLEKHTDEEAPKQEKK